MPDELLVEQLAQAEYEYAAVDDHEPLPWDRLPDDRRRGWCERAGRILSSWRYRRRSSRRGTGCSGGGMPDPRDTARQWLTEVHERTDCPHAYNPCADCLIPAILSAPGVEVEEEVVRTGPALDPGGEWLPTTTHARVVIRLPAQPIEQTP